MTRIFVTEDCGNAPKKRLLRDWLIAWARRETEEVLEHVSDHVEWNVVGNRQIRGKEDFAKALDGMHAPASELRIENIITHGNVAAAHGTIRYNDGETTYSFCDIFRFSSHSKHAKIKSLTSYVIRVQEP